MRAMLPGEARRRTKYPDQELKGRGKGAPRKTIMARGNQQPKGHSYGSQERQGPGKD